MGVPPGGAWRCLEAPEGAWIRIGEVCSKDAMAEWLALVEEDLLALWICTTGFVLFELHKWCQVDKFPKKCLP